jgi:sigma-E factor negative regulatory protein RseC
MTDSEAIVVRLDGDHAWVDVDSGCSNCGKTSSCGLGDGHGKRLQRVRNTVGARIGDRVVLSVPDGTVLAAAFRAYLLPIALALIGAAVGTTVGDERAAAAGAMVGLAAGWLLLRQASQSESALRIQLKDAVVYLHRNAKP